MLPLDREDIHIISRNSTWQPPGVEQALKDNVYNDKSNWQKFLHWLFISLGIGFTTAGILFFFAYNWASLHKFVKIGLIEGLLVIMATLIVFTRLHLTVKNILLTGIAVLIGVLFAVFGQVYQTGANAYDLFLTWTLAITLFVLIANFAPLWVLYILLINTTLILYEQQVAKDWPEILIFMILFLLDSLCLLVALVLARYKPSLQSPAWFNILLALAAVTMATMGMIAGIFGHRQPAFIVLILAVGGLYTAGFLYGLQRKSLFYLALTTFSVIIILSAFFIKLSDGAGMFLFTSLFVIASVTILIKKLIDTQRKWSQEIPV
ncbi:DUF2157 domain-containing protein [Paraflavitalea soli]|uniref:DUF2157 domain-containing protein n=1 Tax=Paraflavitalea soli TaxID=2315862 RepID=A0A3B7MKK5_9BACT|nr:DUF2157 domain-containing protein [Paraflavitalea soli]AXY73799.1 DUF2157 domain-containing protein [Paraflavitalea soli]